MFKHNEITAFDLHSQIRSGNICFGGNAKFKIYGTLQCKSGKRMKMENRVFFASEKEAFVLGFRPCAHCMNEKYNKWKVN